MSLRQLLQQRVADEGPIRIGVIGAGKFASMFFTQVLNVPEMHVVAVADLAVDRAKAALEATGWNADRYGEISVAEAASSGRTAVIGDARAVLTAPEVEIVLEITGHPIAGVDHAVTAIEHGKHIVMVNVEADSLVGPLLAERAREAGVVYSMAYGDQPALIAELVDWCETVGYEVVAAGKGTKYLPEYEQSTPDTVWDHYGLTAEQIASGGFNPKMFNSFLDGTKSAIEMVAVSNSTGLKPPVDGLRFPPVGTSDLSARMIPEQDGGVLPGTGMVEVVSSLERDGSEIADDLRWGVFVTFKARTDYAVACFAEYGVVTDPSGWYGSLFRPYHMIGMELGVSVASCVLRGEPTGTAIRFAGDVVSIAKRDLVAGDVLDGEGGFTVRGGATTAEESLRLGALPIGLAHGARVVRSVARGDVVTWDDVEVDDSLAKRLRLEMEQTSRSTMTGEHKEARA